MFETDLRGKHTVLAVMHRLDKVAAYDRIAVLKVGRIAEMGQYYQLMAAQGVFYQLTHETASEVGING
jgi:putative ABC transport system ATP-binding protein